MTENGNCWICVNEAATREHTVKKSDLELSFGEVSQNKPVYFSNAYQNNIPVGSFKNGRFKSGQNLCAYCNTTRTQAHDNAWKSVSEALAIMSLQENRPRYFYARKVFKENREREMLNMHLFFVKQMGEIFIEGKIPVDLRSFASSILNNEPNPKLYLNFTYNDSTDDIAAGRSELICYHTGSKPLTYDGEITFGNTYITNHVNVNMIYSTEKNAKNMDNVWHPSLGTTRLCIDNFPSESELDKIAFL